MVKLRAKRKRIRIDVPVTETAADVPEITISGGQDLKPQAANETSKRKRIWREVVPSETTANGFHTFDVDPLDHAETDTRAYMHVSPLLQLVAKHLSKPIAKLGLWDPYFCKGGMVKRLAAIGYEKVHNVNEDFYAVAASGKLPDYDVIISSPPYSGDHLERCLRFCGSQGKAWCLLLPNWVESRPYFREVLGEEANNVFFISPIQRYTYWMPPDLVQGRSKPDWVGQDGGTSPYDSTWMVYLPAKLPRKKIFASLENHTAVRKEWVLANTLKAARYKVKNMAKKRGSLFQSSAVKIGGEAAPPSAGKSDANQESPRVKRRKIKSTVGKLKKSSKWGNTIQFD